MRSRAPIGQLAAVWSSGAAGADFARPVSDTLLGQVGIKDQGTARGTLKILVAGIF